MQKIFNCYRCNEEIYFDGITKSVSGKSIPLDPITKRQHDCPKFNYKPQKKSVADAVIDLEEREKDMIKRIKYE